MAEDGNFDFARRYKPFTAFTISPQTQVLESGESDHSTAYPFKNSFIGSQ